MNNSLLSRLGLALVFLLIALPTLRAQNTRSADIEARIENARIAYITREVALTPEQGQRFWPLYNEYSTKRRDLRRTHDQLRRSATPTMTDDQARDNLKQIIAVSKNELNMTEDYFAKFQKVISARQVAQLYKAEREFGRVMMKEMKTERQASGPRGRSGRPATTPGTSN
ncbi:hypothetical protein [Hymenobacter sp. HDW8]|uniref:hypothetical protein n=1 Tax=Hymenobacter sp. HDW8 TaxID=2714932 RepID=UPI001409E335|nr:hypothetical protein [Hymenobacter sp. HDW8]QIL75200.1 hypothetical protein G7064_04555 [Hymenobacter sp. HDW8]